MPLRTLDESGVVVERYVYDPYGGTAVLTGDGSPVLREADRGYFFDANYNQVIDDNADFVSVWRFSETQYKDLLRTGNVQ